MNDAKDAAKPVDLEELADRVYEEHFVGSQLWEDAYKRYPAYNTGQAAEAAEWMLQNTPAALRELPEWEAIQDLLFEKLVAGMT